MWPGYAVTSSTLLADPPSNETIDVFYIKSVKNSGIASTQVSCVHIGMRSQFLAVMYVYNFLLMCFHFILEYCKKKSKKIRSHSDPKMKLSICDAKIMNNFGDFFQNFKKVGFWKIQISKIF